MDGPNTVHIRPKIDAERDRHPKDEAVTALGEAQEALIAAESEAAGKIAELETTNALLARREKEASDEHTRLRAIITAQNSKKADSR